MKAQKEDKYTLYTIEQNDQNNLAQVLMEIDAAANIIIDCSVIAISEELAASLSKNYEAFTNAHKSFVVVISDKLDMEAFEELFIAVPTISEAIEYIYMEELERNF